MQRRTEFRKIVPASEWREERMPTKEKSQEAVMLVKTAERMLSFKDICIH